MLKKDTEVTQLKNQLTNKDTENKLKEQTLRESFQNQLKMKEKMLDINYGIGM